MSRAKLRNLPYCRASRDQNDTFSSVDTQAELGLAVGERNSWRNLTPIIDNDLSAAEGSKERPGFEMLKDMVKAKKVDIVTVFSTSRASRDVEEFNALLKMLAAHGVLLCVNGSIIDPNNPEDALKARITNLFDSYFIEQLRKNVNAAMEKNARNGKPHGPIPFGFTRVYDPETKTNRQVPHPEEADKFRRYVREYLAGTMSLRQIAWDMDRSPQAVTRMLTNPTYIGMRRHHDVTYTASWPALITEEEHRALVRIIESRRKGPQQSPQRRYPFTGFIVCGKCGAKIACMRTSARPLLFKCRKFSCTSIVAEPLNSYLAGALQDRIDGMVFAGADTSEEEKLVELRRRLDTVNEEAKELRARYKAKRLTLDEYEEFRDDAEEQAAQIQAEIDDLSPNLELDSLKGAVVAKMTDEELHVTALRLIDTVTLLPVGSGKAAGVPVKDRVVIVWK